MTKAVRGCRPAFCRGSTRWRSDRDAAEIAVPVLMLHGEEDVLIPPGEGLATGRGAARGGSGGSSGWRATWGTMISRRRRTTGRAVEGFNSPDWRRSIARNRDARRPVSGT